METRQVAMDERLKRVESMVFGALILIATTVTGAVLALVLQGKGSP